jgi:hypothetical protein
MIAELDDMFQTFPAGRFRRFLGVSDCHEAGELKSRRENHYIGDGARRY